MAQISDATLKTAVAKRLGFADSSGLSSKWDAIVTDANSWAWREIQRKLGARGYTATQIDAWDDGAEYNTKLGLFWALTNGEGLQAFDVPALRSLDCRAELQSVQIVIGGAVTSPGTASKDQVGYGQMTNTNDFFTRDQKW